MAASKTYAEQQNIKYAQKINELLKIFPEFCREYFNSLEYSKQKLFAVLQRGLLRQKNKKVRYHKTVDLVRCAYITARNKEDAQYIFLSAGLNPDR